MKRWFANPAVIIIALASIVAMLMAGLVVLLLPQSGEIIRIAQWRTARAKTMAIDAELTYQGEVDEKNGQTVTGHRRETAESATLTKIDNRNAKEPRLATDFSLFLGESDRYQGRTVRVGSARFLRFSKLPAMLGNFPLDRLADRWLTYDPEAIRAKIPLPVIGGKGAPPDAAAENKTLEYLRSTPFFTVRAKLKNEKIGGVAVLHYQVAPEILFIKDFVIRSEELRLDRELDDRERRQIDAFFADISADDGEIWIGRSDYFLYRLRLRFRYDDGGRRGTLTLAASLGEFNRPMVINPPDAQADDIDRVIASLLPGLTKHLQLAGAGTAQHGAAAKVSGLQVGVPGGSVAEADRDNDKLPDALEYFYQTDADNPDTDGDGIGDGAEVDAGTNPRGSGQLFDFGISGR
ncbi:hypothetical protein HY633_03470 [Candidatus Uhrbacteria bacterium]|nr:hypothetical protein [Candidatus Uhrbacteria bacterium]